MSGDPMIKCSTSTGCGRSSRRRSDHKSRSIWLRFWSRVGASKWLLAVTVVVGLLILFGLFLGGIAVFDWSESTAFCSLCHVMKPEYTAYKNSPHCAR